MSLHCHAQFHSPSPNPFHWPPIKYHNPPSLSAIYSLSRDHGILLSRMQSLNGVLIMLSFMARNQVTYKLPGQCPVPVKPSTLFDAVPPKLTNYNTALHYNSETQGGHLFGSNRKTDELNCLRLDFINVTSMLIILQDCEFYQGYLTIDANTTDHYDMLLKNVDVESSCLNQTIQIDGLSVWADAKRDFIVFWSCSNDAKMVSHKQVVVVFISSDVTTNSNGYTIDPKMLQRVTKFTKEVVAFSGLNVTDFDVNAKLLVDQVSDCSTFNCSNHCDPVDAYGTEGGGGAGGPLIFFIVICFVVIIVFMVLL